MRVPGCTRVLALLQGDASALLQTGDENPTSKLAFRKPKEVNRYVQDRRFDARRMAIGNSDAGQGFEKFTPDASAGRFQARTYDQRTIWRAHCQCPQNAFLADRG